jgi:hypothetical protein
MIEDTEQDQYEYALDLVRVPASEHKTISEIHGDYFRNLSANYSTYQASGKWPARPEGLVLVEPMSDADLARA